MIINSTLILSSTYTQIIQIASLFMPSCLFVLAVNKRDDSVGGLCRGGWRCGPLIGKESWRSLFARRLAVRRSERRNKNIDLLVELRTCAFNLHPSDGHRISGLD
ncbi:hypothetical protein BpHYR1_004139 [Brachionus plicatilis]|uniref:Uncharacterized protein n=1 Tax=Brachionus plicatilis TaxID=10195 RepID=A0A3M7QI04_BRAPC|nr:hypothetical protein BpHYR1_004139 [Brachionus plicatilis]